MDKLIRNWIRLFLWLAFIYCTFFLIAGQKTPGIIGDMLESTDSKGIEADALFYAETELSTESAQKLRFHMIFETQNNRNE